MRHKKGASPVILAVLASGLSVIGVTFAMWGASQIRDSRVQTSPAVPVAEYSQPAVCQGGRVAGSVAAGIAETFLFEGGWSADFNGDGDVDDVLNVGDAISVQGASGPVTVNSAIGCWTVSQI